MIYRHAEEEVCEKFDIDPDRVETLARKLKKVADECRKEGILIFAGTFGGLVFRPSGHAHSADNNLADGIAFNCDGGDGGDR